MASALVVGDRGSGLTTFVGLLYAAQLRLGTEEGDEFRFSAERETILQLEEVYGELVAGRFPEWDADWEAHPLSFVFGFRSGKFGRFVGGSIGSESGFDAFRVQVGGISVETISELAEHDAILEETTRRLLRSSVILPLVDASRLWPPMEGRTVQPLARYDQMLATTFELVSQFLAAEHHRRFRTLHPLFVVTKFDQCPETTRAELLAPLGPPSAWSLEQRGTVGGKILERYFPATTQFFVKPKPKRSTTIASPLWFFSSLQLVPGSGGPDRIARRSRVPLGGWEPEYPFEEYRVLIEHLGYLAHRLPGWEERP